MRIAVLGAGGFVGRELAGYLLHNHHVTPVTRATVDLLDPVAVKQYLTDNKFDVIINAAAIMTENDALADTRNNLGIFMNFYNNSNLFKKFINLASGAEYDRTQDINNADESMIFERIPKDSYGFGQNVKSRLAYHKPGFYNLRIFNCFGKEEADTRIFPRFLKKKSKFEITGDRYFDFFSIQDLCKVVESFVENDHVVYDINCVYMTKYKISEVVKMFAEIRGVKSDFKVLSTSENNYTGNGELLDSLDIELAGLEQGFRDYE
jgi:nucleoside-diphosphate-sugar epimerase